MEPNQKKENFNAFSVENFVRITENKTDKNQYEIACGVCGKIYYADPETADYFNCLIKQDLDNPFLCGDCQNAFEESVVQDR